MYEYRAVDKNGRYIEGKSSRAREDIENYLEIKGYYPIVIRKLRVRKLPSLKKKLGSRELYIFCNNMALALAAGISITNGLEINAYSMGKKQDQLGLDRIRNNILRGKTFYSSLREEEVFPNFLVNMVRIGEMSGRLDEIFLRLADYYRNKNELEKELKNILIYPLILILATLASMVFLILKVVPSFTSLYEEYGGELPKYTRILMRMGSFDYRDFLDILIVLILAYLLVRLLRNLNYFNRKFDRLALYIPLYREMLTLEFTELLSILLNSNIQLYDSLKLIEKTMENSYFKGELGLFIESLEEGIKFSSLSLGSQVLSKEVYGFILIGEETGKMAEIMDSGFRYLSSNFNYKMKKLAKLIEPAILLIISLVIAFLVLAMVLPMFNIVELVF